MDRILWRWRVALGVQLIALTAVLGLATSPAQAARVALVMGNQAYVAGPLKNPVNDAEAVGGALRGLGFNVTLVKNFNVTTSAARWKDLPTASALATRWWCSTPGTACR